MDTRARKYFHFQKLLKKQGTMKLDTIVSLKKTPEKEIPKIVESIGKKKPAKATKPKTTKKK